MRRRQVELKRYTERVIEQIDLSAMSLRRSVRTQRPGTGCPVDFPFICLSTPKGPLTASSTSMYKQWWVFLVEIHGVVQILNF